MLRDLDPMPFGKYKGVPMQDVPATYLHWLWHDGEANNKTSPVHEYINFAWSQLRHETPSLIWKKTL